MFRLAPPVAILLAMSGILHCHADDRVETIRNIVSQQLETTKTPGAVLGIYRDGQTIAEAEVGLSSIDPLEPIRIDQHFRIGSITKAFLGVVIMQLVDEGKLSLDDKLSKYFPDYPEATDIKIGQLGSMTARIKDPLYSRKFKRDAESEPLRVWRAEELIQATANLPRWPDDSDERWHYSNTAAVLLGQVVQQITGRSLGDAIQSRIFEPLEMRQTGYELSAKLPKPVCRGYSFAPADHILGRDGKTIRDVTMINPSLWNAAGAMYSTLGDLCRFTKALGTGQLVASESFAVQTDWQSTPWENHEYGFLLAKIQGLIGHDGDIPGYSSFIGYRARDNLTIVVLANLHGWSVGKMPANEIAAAVLESL